MLPTEIELDRPLPAHEDEDCRLLQLVAGGDRQALERLYNRHGRALFRFLSTLSRERGLAEEILQDTFVAVWRSAASYEARSSARVWLFGIARRQAHNTLRRRQPASVALDGLAENADGFSTPEGHALAGERRADITAALGRLPAIQREALALVFVEGLSYREAAAVLGIPEGTIKSRLNHARRALRALVQSREEP